MQNDERKVELAFRIRVIGLAREIEVQWLRGRDQVCIGILKSRGKKRLVNLTTAAIRPRNFRRCGISRTGCSLLFWSKKGRGSDHSRRPMDNMYYTCKLRITPAPSASLPSRYI
jgi:hypothetical protein